MSVISEERTLIIECYSHMQQIADVFNKLSGAKVEKRDPNDMSDGEMLTEMRDALIVVRGKLGPALESPMIQMMLKRMG
jgi:hypothetical protein